VQQVGIITGSPCETDVGFIAPERRPCMNEILLKRAVYRQILN
jgi:hypothetical protein